MGALKSEGLVCPYSKCGRSFRQPVLVTDCSKLPRETHYACPHCLLRLELSMEGGGLGRVHVEAEDDDLLLSRLEVGNKGLGEAVSSHRASRPSKSCRHFLGYLRGLPEGAGIPDVCAVCPNIMQCYVKRE
ncbi:MAG: hypothetical protein OEX01_03805 [Candidatus Bathyarchaeota archaeon]|nr:hypothetical protein [Candidatus Bathyarchaeota archaeon]